MFTSKQSDIFYNDDTKEMFVCVVSSVTADKCDGTDEVIYGAVPLVYKIDKDTNYKSIAYPPNLSTFSTDNYSDLFAVTPTCPEGTNFETITKPTINYNKNKDRYSVTFLGNYSDQSDGLAITNFVFQNINTELYLIDTKTLIPKEKFTDSPYTYVGGTLNSNLIIGGNTIRNGKDSYYGEYERSPDPQLGPIHVNRTKPHDTLSFNVSLQQTNTTVDSITGNAIFPVLHTGGYITYKPDYVAFDPEQNIRVDFRARSYNVPTMTAYGSNQNASLSATRWYSQYSPASSATVSGGAGFCVYFYKNDCTGVGIPNGVGDSLGYAVAETQTVEVAGSLQPVDGIVIKKPNYRTGTVDPYGTIPGHNVGIGSSYIYGDYSATNWQVARSNTSSKHANITTHPADSFLGVGFDITGNFCLLNDDMSGWYQHGGSDKGSHTQAPCSIGIRGSRFHNTQVLTCVPMTGVATASAVPIHTMVDSWADIDDAPWVDYRVDLSNRGSKVTIYNKLTGASDYNTIAEFKLSKPVYGSEKYDPWSGFNIQDNKLPLLNAGLTFTSSTYASFFELQSFEVKGVQVHKPCTIRTETKLKNELNEATDYLEESSKNLRERLVDIKVDDDEVDVELIIPPKRKIAKRIKQNLADKATLCDLPQEEEIQEEVEIKYTGLPPEQIVGVVDKVSRGEIPDINFTPNIKTTKKTFDKPDIIIPTEPVIWEPPTEPCGGKLVASGKQGWPCEFRVKNQDGTTSNQKYQTIALGTDTGKVYLDFTAFQVPDRFIVYWDDKPVIDTGYVGKSSYKSKLKKALKDKGYSDLEADLHSIIGHNGRAYFIKDKRFPSIAKLYAWAPLEGTAWEASLQCVKEGDFDTNENNGSNILEYPHEQWLDVVEDDDSTETQITNTTGITVTPIPPDPDTGKPIPIKEKPEVQAKEN